MSGRNLKIAWASIRAAKWRSLLTISGVVIGIVSVITIVSLGEGLKRQVVGQINRVGGDLIIIRPGKLVSRDANGSITGVDLDTRLLAGGGSLSDEDVRIAANTPGVAEAIPIGLFNTSVKVGSAEFSDIVVIGTSSGFGEELTEKLSYGSFFTTDEQARPVTVVSPSVGAQLFAENVPIGRQLSIRGQTFLVRGVTQPFEQIQFSLDPDFNRAIFIPYELARELSDGSLQVSQIVIRPTRASEIDDVVRELNARFFQAHGGQTDFAVLKQDENLLVTKSVLDLFTALIGGIAALSLLVGGVGIMNIMLVSVTERTREIGIRKAVGATNRQILGQFLAEAALLSGIGGVIGIIAAALLNGILRVTSELKPVMTLPIIGVALAVSLAVGIIFGMMPAVRAARKDPIEALRE